MGLTLDGLYLRCEDEDDDRPFVARQFRQRLVGRVVKVAGATATLTDPTVKEIALDKAFLEPSLQNFESVGRQLLGGQY